MGADEKRIIPPEEAKDQLLLRARHCHLVRVCLDVQEFRKLDDATTFALLACYLSDVVEYLSNEIRVLRDHTPAPPILVEKSKVSPEWLTKVGLV